LFTDLVSNSILLFVQKVCAQQRVAVLLTTALSVGFIFVLRDIFV
jgi:hypothetical protein